MLVAKWPAKYLWFYFFVSCTTNPQSPSFRQLSVSARSHSTCTSKRFSKLAPVLYLCGLYDTCGLQLFCLKCWAFGICLGNFKAYVSWDFQKQINYILFYDRSAVPNWTNFDKHQQETLAIKHQQKTQMSLKKTKAESTKEPTQWPTSSNSVSLNSEGLKTVQRPNAMPSSQEMAPIRTSAMSTKPEKKRPGWPQSQIFET